MKRIYVLLVAIGLLVAIVISCNTDKSPISGQQKLINKDSILAIYSKLPYIVDTKVEILSIDAEGRPTLHAVATCGEGTTKPYACPSGYYDTTHTYICYNMPYYYWLAELHRHYVGMGDINNDNDIDIADLTALIDYCNCDPIGQKFHMVAADFVPDGNVDYEDVTALISFLYIAGWESYPCSPCPSQCYGEQPSVYPPYQGCYPIDVSHMSSTLGASFENCSDSFVCAKHPNFCNEE